MVLRCSALLACAALWFVAGHARAAESYDNCVGFIDSLPATITTQGVWCLRKDLSTAMASGPAIRILANNVTIDCNDFKMGGLAAGDGSASVGILAQDRHNVRIRHCNLRGFFIGIDLQGDGQVVESNQVGDSLLIGIRVAGHGSLVRGNRVLDTGGAPPDEEGVQYSIGIDALADVVDNLVDGVYAEGTSTYAYGIRLDQDGFGNVARGNTVRRMDAGGNGLAVGIWAREHQVVEANTIANGPGDSTVVSYGVWNGLVCRDNTVFGYPTAYENCAVVIGDAP
jgi:hypothetical protein